MLSPIIDIKLSNMVLSILLFMEVTQGNSILTAFSSSYNVRQYFQFAYFFILKLQLQKEHSSTFLLNFHLLIE